MATYMGITGIQGCTATHFGEQYRVLFADGDIIDVYVWIKHGDNEKDNHQRAVDICENLYPTKQVLECTYC